MTETNNEKNKNPLINSIFFLPCLKLENAIKVFTCLVIVSIMHIKKV